MEIYPYTRLRKTYSSLIRIVYVYPIKEIIVPIAIIPIVTCRNCFEHFESNSVSWIFCPTCMSEFKKKFETEVILKSVETRIIKLTESTPKPKKPYYRKDGIKQSARRKRRILTNGGSHTIEEWDALLVKNNFCCPTCGISAKDTPQGFLTRDHILEISLGGTDNIENIQPMCLKCNFEKETKRQTKTL